MYIIGIILAIIFSLFGIGIICLYTLPYVIGEIKCISYKIESIVGDIKSDIDKRSAARRNRLERKRERVLKLKDKKLDAKISKVNIL